MAQLRYHQVCLLPLRTYLKFDVHYGEWAAERAELLGDPQRWFKGTPPAVTTKTYVAPVTPPQFAAGRRAALRPERPEFASAGIMPDRPGGGGFGIRP